MLSMPAFPILCFVEHYSRRVKTNRMKNMFCEKIIWNRSYSSPMRGSQLHIKISKGLGTSLVAQGQRICLPTHKTQVVFLIREDSTCHRAIKSMHRSCWAQGLEPASLNSWAHKPQLLKSVCPRGRAPQQANPLQGEAYAPRLERSLHSNTARKNPMQQQGPSTAKNKIKLFFKTC